jgi:hypothetical protein
MLTPRNSEYSIQNGITETPKRTQMPIMPTSTTGSGLYHGRSNAGKMGRRLQGKLSEATW